MAQARRFGGDEGMTRENTKSYGKKVKLGKMQNGGKSHLLGLCKFIWDFTNSLKYKTENA